MAHPHPNHETALMLLRAAGLTEGYARTYFDGEYADLSMSQYDISAMAAAVDAREKAMRDLLASAYKLISEAQDHLLWDDSIGMTENGEDAYRVWKNQYATLIVAAP